MILLGGACLCGWALLSVFATERQRLLSEMEARRPRVAPSASPAAPKPPAGTHKPGPGAGGETGAGKPKRPAAKREPTTPNAR